MSFIEGFKKINKAVDRKIKIIQRSDNKTKKKWLIAGSAVMIVIIVFMWTAYLNLTVPQVGPEEEPVAEETENSSFIKSVSNGASILYTKLEKGISNIVDRAKDIFEKKREFEFSN